MQSANAMIQPMASLQMGGAYPSAQGIALHGGKKASEAQLNKTAQDFEAMFLGQMLQHMFSGIETDPMFGGGHGEDVFKSLLVDEYGKILARSGGVGVADHVKAELLRLQEVQ